jgi:hypothetical protein
MFTEFILVKAVGRYFFNYIMFFGQGEEGGKNCGGRQKGLLQIGIYGYPGE